MAWVRAQDELWLFVSVLTFGEIEKKLAKVDDAKRRQKLRNWVDGNLRQRFD